VFAAARWRLKKTSIDDWYAGASSYRSISVADAGRSAAKPPAAVVAADQWDRQEGRTDVRTLHRPCSACDADSVNSSTARQGSTLSFVEARPAAAGGVCGAAVAAAGLVGTLFRLPG